MQCSVCSNEFELESEDISGFAKFGFEPPEMCPQCMHMKRLCFRNERVFYRRKCDATGESIISIYAPDSKYKVYKSESFFSDKWDALEFGRDFDFNRPFFEQFHALKLQVPRLAIHNLNHQNSEYCNTCVGNKNSYFIFGGDYHQDCMYGILGAYNKSSSDIDYCYRCELLYFCSDVIESYGSRFLFNSSHCSDCYFCEGCVGCRECILSFDMQNQEYCIENKKYPREEYLKRKSELITGKLSDTQKLLARFKEMRGKRIVKNGHIVSCQDCTGDYLKHSKNCTKCFDVEKGQDSREIIYGIEIKDCFHSDLIGLNSSLSFNSVSIMNVYNVMMSFWVLDSSNVAYSDFCLNSHDLFGCVGLNHKDHCIFNKKYSESEYKILREKIIEHMKRTGEWGKFFPPELSCFGYNEATSQTYYPLTKERALQLGFKWYDEAPKPHIKQTYKIPDDIKDVNDGILNEVLECPGCGKNFKIIEQELHFLRDQNIPILGKCSYCRMKERDSLRNPRVLFNRQCEKCGVQIQTTYAPDRPETVYCEKCYFEAVY